MSYWSSLWFQDSQSMSMDMVDVFHDSTMLVLVLITCSLAFFMLDCLFSKVTAYSIVESQTTEFIWTVLPSFILLAIAIPSLRILYLMDESSNPYLTLKVMGSQWWWNYEYTNFPNLTLESYLSPSCKMGDFRLLEVDNRPTIPINKSVRLLLSSTDVLHSWSVPALGLKMDANPGRVNQMTTTSHIVSIVYGSCTEICGANHSFMPITLESAPALSFSKWALSLTS